MKSDNATLHTAFVYILRKYRHIVDTCLSNFNSTFSWANVIRHASGQQFILKIAFTITKSVGPNPTSDLN